MKGMSISDVISTADWTSVKIFYFRPTVEKSKSIVHLSVTLHALMIKSLSLKVSEHDLVEHIMIVLLYYNMCVHCTKVRVL